MSDNQQEQDLRVGLARLEGKVDAALTGHGAQIRELTHDVADHESRLRAEERRPRVTPRHLYMGLSAAILVLTGLVAIVTLLR